ncbi:hypothetical protein [Altererythrobacter sp. BO-6]|nr:hypothetical protein [Altererythrobacter sp. BO-6]
MSRYFKGSGSVLALAVACVAASGVPAMAQDLARIGSRTCGE